MDDQSIITLIESFRQDVLDVVKADGTFTRATMMAEIDRIDEMDKNRNGNIKMLMCDTSVWRWTQRNYKIAIPGILLFLLLFIRSSDRIDAPGLFEHVTGIELTDNK